MKCYVPELELGVLAPPPTGWVDKFGGLPWGFPASKWPICACCKRPQSLLAQVRHHPPRIDLGAEGRTLWVFQCEQIAELGCDTTSPEWGSNACLILEAGELEPGSVTPPAPGCPVLAEARVRRWVEDTVEPHDERHWLDFRAGGPPGWLQDDDSPGEAWRFVLQMDNSFEFRGISPTADEAGCKISRQVGDEWVREEPEERKLGAPDPGLALKLDQSGQPYASCDFAWFGDSGLGYVFVNTTGGQAEGRSLWQGL